MPSVAGKKVLIVGDSLSTGPSSPGGVLAAKLQAAGATVKINSRVGRSANNFYGREDYAAQIADMTAFSPDLAIVELGTNDIGLSMAVDGGRMAALKAALGPAEVWAIGPPSFASGTLASGSDAVVAMMRSVFGSGRFIDWRPLSADQKTAGRTTDQVHFTAAGGEIAGDRLAKEFLSAGGGIGWVGVVAVAVLAWAILR